MDEEATQPELKTSYHCGRIAMYRGSGQYKSNGPNSFKPHAFGRVLKKCQIHQTNILKIIFLARRPFPQLLPRPMNLKVNSFKNEANSCVAGVYFVQSTPTPPIPFLHSPNIGHSPMLAYRHIPWNAYVYAGLVTARSTSAQNFPQGSFLSPTVQDDTPEISPLAIAPFPWDWVQPHLWEKGQNAVKIGRGPNDTKVFQVYS